MTCASRMQKAAATVVSAGLAMSATAVAAQTAGSTGLAQFQAGYGGSRYTTAQAQTGSTRDANGNRLIVDGIIQAGASSYSSQSSGASTAYYGSGTGSNSSGTTIGGATAIGNQLNVVVQGNRNTVIVNSKQINNGNITAGTVLNGTLNLND